MTVQITEHGIDAAAASLMRIKLDTLRATVIDLLRQMASDAAVYPPELPGQRYVRTNALHDGWTDGVPVVDSTGQSLVGVITNSVPYGPDVQSADDQARIHQGRWRTVEQIMDAWEDRVAAALADDLDRVIA
jgi:hypothetical protein